MELSKTEEKDKIMENSYAMFQIKTVLNFQCLFVTINKLIILTLFRMDFSGLLTAGRGEGKNAPPL